MMLVAAIHCSMDLPFFNRPHYSKEKRSPVLNLHQRRVIVDYLTVNGKRNSFFLRARISTIQNNTSCQCHIKPYAGTSLLTVKPVLYVCYTCQFINNEQTIQRLAPLLDETSLRLWRLGHLQCWHNAIYLLCHLSYRCGGT